MSERKRGIPEKETICWDCQNYSRCSWARGIPVKGWKATPTEYKDVYGGGERNILTVHSFLVEECPHFKPDDKRRVLFKEIAKIIGKSERNTYTIKRKKGIGRIKDLLKEKGYKLHVYKDEERRSYYLEKI